MKKIIKPVTFLLVLALLLSTFTPSDVNAAEKPSKPTIQIKLADDVSDSVVITIKKTKNAEGYSIYAKAEDESKYKSICEIKQDGTAVRTYTYSGLKPGTYSFKVKAYKKSGAKKVWGKYSAVKKITVTAGTTAKDSTPTGSKASSVRSAVKATSIKVNSISGLHPGETSWINVTVTPANAYGQITFKSANEAIARVNGCGRVVAMGKGKTQITATAFGGASCTFTVSVDYDYPVLTYKLNKSKTEATITGCDKNAYMAYIPATYKNVPVTGIDGNAFADCEELAFFVADKNQKKFYTENGALFTNDPVKTLVRVPNKYVNEYGEFDEYFIPEGTKAVGDYAFAGYTSWSSVYYPESVTELGSYVFYKVKGQVISHVTDSLTRIGKAITLDQRANVVFSANRDSYTDKYCDEHSIPCSCYFDFDKYEKTVSTTWPTHLAGSEYKATPAKGIATCKSVNRTALSPTLLKKEIDISSYQKKGITEVRIPLEEVWSDIIPDGNGNTFGYFPAMTGVYGTGYTDGSATLVGFDLTGKAVAVQKVSGNFIYAFEGAVNLGVVGGSNTCITAIPYEPEFITSSGYMPMNSKEWNVLPSGVGFKYYVLCFPRGSADDIVPGYIDGISSSQIKDSLGRESKDSPMFSSYCVYFNCSPLVNIAEEPTIHFSSLDKILDNDELVVFVKNTYNIRDSFGDDVYRILSAVKQTMVGKYYPKKIPIAQITVSVDGTYPCSSESKVYLSDYYADASFNNIVDTLAHEMTHAIDQSIPQTGIAPNTWMEGRAQYIEEIVAKKLGVTYFTQYTDDFDWSFLYEEDKADFAHYFFYNKDRQAPYAVGYFFIKYICEKYGDDVTAKIMTNLSKITETYQYGYPAAHPSCAYSWLDESRKEELFRDCVVKATSETVFQDFVRDVIEK